MWLIERKTFCLFEMLTYLAFVSHLVQFVPLGWLLDLVVDLNVGLVVFLDTMPIQALGH